MCSFMLPSGSQGPETPESPLPLSAAKAGRNHLNEQNTPLLPNGIGEQDSQTISNLSQAALLHRCITAPYMQNNLTILAVPLYQPLL